MLLAMAPRHSRILTAPPCLSRLFSFGSLPSLLPLQETFPPPRIHIVNLTFTSCSGVTSMLPSLTTASKMQPELPVLCPPPPTAHLHFFLSFHSTFHLPTDYINIIYCLRIPALEGRLHESMNYVFCSLMYPQVLKVLDPL